MQSRFTYHIVQCTWSCYCWKNVKVVRDLILLSISTKQITHNIFNRCPSQDIWQARSANSSTSTISHLPANNATFSLRLLRQRPPSTRSHTSHCQIYEYRLSGDWLYDSFMSTEIKYYTKSYLQPFTRESLGFETSSSDNIFCNDYNNCSYYNSNY